MTRSGQKRYKLLRLSAAKNTTEHKGKFVPKGDVPMPGPSENGPGTTMVTFVTATIDPRGWWLRISWCWTQRWPLAADRNKYSSVSEATSSIVSF